MTWKICLLSFQLSFPAPQIELLILYSFEQALYNYRIHRLIIYTVEQKKKSQNKTPNKPTRLRKTTCCSASIKQVVSSIPKSSGPKNIIKPVKSQQTCLVMAACNVQKRFRGYLPRKASFKTSSFSSRNLLSYLKFPYLPQTWQTHGEIHISSMESPSINQHSKEIPFINPFT